MCVGIIPADYGWKRTNNNNNNNKIDELKALATLTAIAE